jgi:hypothetical protein
VKPFENVAVASAFAMYPEVMRSKLLLLRELILETAAATEGVGKVEETIRWGEPAYITPETGSGSTIRIGMKKSDPPRYAMYFHCQTNLVGTFRTMFPFEFKFEGNRAIVFHQSDDVPIESLSICIAAALTYHRKKAERSSECR